jgi:hypothetical protein
VVDINIPLLAPEPMLPTVVAPDEPQVASEPAITAASGLVDCFGDEIKKEDLKPSDKRYKSVEEMVENTLGSDFLALVTSEDQRAGKDVEEEENHQQFKCTDGFYVIPPALYSDFCAAFGAPTVDRELTLARLWVETNPAKRKTRRGMGRFLNAWLCRAQGEQRTPLKARSGSLLEGCNNTQQGW